MLDDLILSVVKDRNWSDIDCYAQSLSFSGYAGKAVMFVNNIPDDAIACLRSLGFEVIPFTTGSSLHFQTDRFEFIYSYLLNNWYKFRYVMLTDVCDLVFQTNPIEYMEKHPARLIGAKEGRLIKNQGINTVWIERLNLPSEETAFLKEQEILCSGTIQGEFDAVLSLVAKMREKIGINDMQGIDQGIYNWAARQLPFRDMMVIPEMEEGFISTCGSFLSTGEDNNPGVWTVQPPYFDWDTGLVMTPDKSRPYSIVHQYNRAYGLHDSTGSWRSTLERRYR